MIEEGEEGMTASSLKLLQEEVTKSMNFSIYACIDQMRRRREEREERQQ
jgi:hypothetical protein